MSRQIPLVLVVDDESHIVNVLAMKLKQAGYAVVTAEDGEQALELALAQGPDLVITDYQMPFLSGLELAQRLREGGLTSATPVLMLTARGFTIPPEALAQTNIRAVLSKPFSPRDVASRVEALLPPAGEGRRIHVEATNA
ncbi:MAG: response regulator [Phycisphaeraceae bacterium]